MFKQKQIACISDIHLGVHQDSQRWHNIALSFARWLDEQLTKHNIQDLVISGDIFHNRHEIGVNTLHAAYDFFKILEKYNIIAITGNHDCYLRDKSDINSISILQNSNITVFEELKTVEVFGRKITFCPWGVQVESVPNSDIIFGHFEIQNFKMNQHKICDHGVDTQSLLDRAQIIISGHFHYREHRKYHNDKSILYLGSPYELDFGDREQEKGVTLLSIDTLETQFIKNDVTPKHKKIKLTDLIQNISPEYMAEIFTNNFINLNVDKKIDPYRLDALLNSLSQYSPCNVRTEFNIFDEIQLTEEVDGISIDIDTALHEFIELLDTDISKQEILDKSIEIYKLSLATNE
jgi:DNA repair exonuclease SbcCD nuclease subunit